MSTDLVFSRVSPLQKALVVKLVKRNTKALLLAIGDGANDVSMIQAAHVGVGISGVEGLQAARSADVAIGQFRFLRKLLLVHGAWSYQRISKVILYSYYKNITMFMTQFWVSRASGEIGSALTLRCSIPFKMPFPGRSSSSPGLYPSTMSSSPFFRLLSWAFSTNSFRPASLIVIPSSTSLGKRASSSRCTLSSRGFLTAFTIR